MQTNRLHKKITIPLTVSLEAAYQFNDVITPALKKMGHASDEIADEFRRSFKQSLEDLENDTDLEFPLLI